MEGKEQKTHCPKCSKYVKTSGENAILSMEGTPQEHREHTEGWCPKKVK